MACFSKMGNGCFRNKKEKTQAVASGLDVMNDAMVEAKLNPQHLVIMVNGLIGRFSLYLIFFFFTFLQFFNCLLTVEHIVLSY